MRCPHCGATTEVTEKRGPFRTRRCLNVACRYDFATSENLVTHAEHRRVNLRALALSRAQQSAQAPRVDHNSANAAAKSHSA